MRKFLKSVLVGESKAYGFTLAFWGSGALLINEYGVPGFEEVVAYIVGAVIGFGMLSIICFRHALEPATSEESEYLVMSTIHFISALSPVVFVQLILGIDPLIAFAVAGIAVSVLYNSFLLVEKLLSDELKTLEQKLKVLF